MGLFQFGKDRLQGVQVVGDGAVEAGFPAPAFGHGNGDVFRMDIESDEQSFFLHGVLFVGWFNDW